MSATGSNPEVAFANLHSDVRAVVLISEGEHFSAGLDLSSLTQSTIVERSPVRNAGIVPSRAFNTDS